MPPPTPCPIFFILCYLLLSGTWVLFNLVWQLWIVSKIINVRAFVCIAQLIPWG